MRDSQKFLAWTAICSVSLIVAAAEAQAGSFAIREQSATGQGMSFSGVAAGSAGLSSMFWNPATITMSPGFRFEGHASVIFPEAKINPDLPTLGLVGALGGTPVGSGNIGQTAVVPATYASYQVNDRLWLGVSINSPYGFITKPDQNWAGQTYGRSSKAFSINVTPTIGYKVTDWLSIGVGLQVQYLDVTLKRALGLSPLAPAAILEGDAYGVGYTLGLTLTPLEGTEIGLGFRSSIRHQLDGNMRLGPATVVPIKANVNLPEVLTFGVSQRLSPQWKVMAGVEWTNWSRLNIVPVTSAITGTAVTALPFSYRDGWFFSVGAEYQMTEQLALRAGLGYELSPITDRTRDVRIPDNDRLWASIGATYQWNEQLSFDIGYTHIFVKDTDIRLVPGNPQFAALPFVAEVKPSVDIVSVALKYRWDEPAKPIPAPIVRKY